MIYFAKTAIAATAVFGLAAAFTTVAPTSSEAKVTQKWELSNKDICYKKKTVPATVEYNTQGKLKHAASRVWVEKNGKVVDKHVDAVYFTTKRVLEEQHTTLVKTKC